jgi:hypothetical protein
MTIAYNRVTTGRTAQQMGLDIDTVLKGAGWTLEYADADAITGGTAAAPGWGKAFATGVSAGRVVYRMPATTLTTRWYVEIEILWGTSLNIFAIGVRTATGVSGAGVLTNPGTQIRPNNSATNNSGECIVSASEHGFAIGQALGLSSGYALCVERKRNLAGAQLDDLVVHGISVGIATNGLFLAPGGGVNRNVSGGENGAVEYLLVRKAITGSTAFNTSEPTSLAGAGALRGVAMGPLIASGGLGGMSGHMLLFPTADAPAGNDLTVSVAGVDRLFGVAANNTATASRIGFLKP